jgi:alcohol dehydrogenase class IV
MRSFVYGGLPARVVFGDGTLAQLSGEVERLGLSRALILSTPEQAAHAEEIRSRIGARAIGVCALATMHTPVSVTERALQMVKSEKVDGVISVGGGSTIGLGKAIALRTDLPQIAVPTTYAGSEMTPILGETKDGVKTTQRSPKVLPEVVLYDVALTMTLPVALAGVSGLNAIAHAVEALYAEDRNPVIDLMAIEGIEVMGRALLRLAQEPQDRQARSDALYGSFLSGACLGAVGMALHHKLCHTLGGSFDLPHAETHAIVLPHAVAYNAIAVPREMERVAKALGAGNAATALFDLSGKIGAKRALRDLGMPESGIDMATDLALRNAYFNPRPLERAAIHELIARAWAGEPPIEDQRRPSAIG